ncbi:MAG: hypothetical protein HXY34_11005 [Candidatus Thorarchaeota archaeon]|nr:hypothetical protein [Candidatus Thorarchaeota archaeon]
MEKSEKICSVQGCDKPSKKSFSTTRIGETLSRSGLKTKDPRARRVYLCADHYKKIKKAYKEDTKPERMRWGH